MRAYLETEHKPIRVKLVAYRFNAFYGAHYIECICSKGRRRMVLPNELHTRAVNLKDYYKYSGTPDLSKLPAAGAFLFSEVN